MTTEETLLEQIKFVLISNNESQAIRLIEQYGFYKQGKYNKENN